MAKRSKVEPVIPKRATTLTHAESDAFREFVRVATQECGISQSELAKAAGVSQPRVSSAMNDVTKPAGGKLARGIAEATGIPLEDIVSGVGVQILRERKLSGIDREQVAARRKAAQALAVLYDSDIATVLSVFEESRIVLPSGVPALSWFDIGRAELEKRRSLLVSPKKSKR